jgi:hypothetical protein
MTTAKDVVVKVISSSDANRVIRAIHYSGKVVPNSQLHFGVFIGDKCHGAMQFGPSTVKRNLIGLVRGTLWHEFIELNRMAFADTLPRNSESRCIAYALRYIKKHYPQIKWVVSFADGTQCGDGTIYRASGFVLTSIKKNNGMYRMPNGEVISKLTMQVNPEYLRKNNGSASPKKMIEDGGVLLNGVMLRYIYILDKSCELTCPILPFSEIDRQGARMYKGKNYTRGVSADSGTTGDQPERGGANPTTPLTVGAAQ